MVTRPNDPAAPIRTCVGCLAKRPQAELVRCVLDAGGLAHVDRRGRNGRGGRGAWLCGPACLDDAVRRRGFERAWRTNERLAPDSFDSLREELANLVRD